MEITDSINIFLEIHSNDKNLESYRNDLNLFLNYFPTLKDTDQLDSSYLSNFSFELSLKNFKPSTIRKKILSIQTFFAFLEMSQTRKGLLVDVDLPKYDKTLPVVLTQDEVSNLLNSIDTSKSNGIKLKAIFNLMYSTGIKVSELINLKLDDIDFEDKNIKIRENKTVSRIIPIRESALEDLNKYLVIRNKSIIKDKQTIFLNKNGEKLSRQYLCNELKKIGVKADIYKPLHPEILRHSFATHLLENGASLKVVQELLGHKSIETTKIYTYIFQSNNQRAYSLYWNKK